MPPTDKPPSPAEPEPEPPVEPDPEPPSSTVEPNPKAHRRAVKNVLARIDADAGLRGDDRVQRWGAGIKAVPGFMAALARVPSTHWLQEFAGEQGEVHLARVRCTCGNEVLVEEGGKRDCECPRIFIYLGRDKLYVANSPVLNGVDDLDAS